MNQTYKKLIPALSAEEYEGLEKSILADGCRDAIVVWGDTIIDGHNRYEICTKHGIEFRTVDKKFTDETDAKIWIIRNQFGRRNISTYQRAELALALKPLIAEKAKKNQGTRTDICQKSDESFTPIDTKKELAKTAGVSHDTIAKVEKIIQDATPEVKAKVESGVMSINEAYKQVKKEETKNDAREKIEAEAHAAETKPVLWHKNYLEFSSSDTGKIDLLITDPPYITEFKEGFSEFVSQWLPKAIASVRSTGRAYICIGAYPDELRTYLNESVKLNMSLENILVWTYRNTLGPAPKYNYKNNWQAILYFKGNDAPPLDCPLMVEQFSVKDINAPDGRIGDRYHTWQKPDALAEMLIRHSTKEGDTVFDPFSGTGTFILAANRLGRTAIGCEIEKEMLEIAEQRGCDIRQ